VDFISGLAVDSKEAAVWIVSSHVGRSLREIGIDGTINVERSSSEVAECKPARNRVRSSETVWIEGKTVLWINVKSFDKSDKISSDDRGAENVRRSVDFVASESSTTD
jgi:hypothetical protein